MQRYIYNKNINFGSVESSGVLNGCLFIGVIRPTNTHEDEQSMDKYFGVFTNRK